VKCEQCNQTDDYHKTDCSFRPAAVANDRYLAGSYGTRLLDAMNRGVYDEARLWMMEAFDHAVRADPSVIPDEYHAERNAQKEADLAWIRDQWGKE